jgi:hypothetical protein
LEWAIKCASEEGLYAVSIWLLLRCGDGDEQENKTRPRPDDEEIWAGERDEGRKRVEKRVKKQCAVLGVVACVWACK